MQNPLLPGVARITISNILLKNISFCSIYILQVGQVISIIFHFIDFFLQTLYVPSHDVALIIASFIIFTKCLNLIS